MNKLEIKYININEIKPYEKNPRKNEKAIPYVMESIKKFGFKNPIILDKNNVIVCGHTRLESAKRLKMEEVPCLYADDLNEEEIKAFRLADNKVAEQADWNADLLQQELDELYSIFNMNDFGFPIQIEDIDEDFIGEEEIAVELGEENNYVVLQFFNEQDWQKAMEVLDIKRVSTTEENKKVRRHGIGRVIDGKTIIDKINN